MKACNVVCVGRCACTKLKVWLRILGQDILGKDILADLYGLLLYKFV